MSAESIIKSQARDILKHNFVKAIAALVIMLVPFYIIDGTTTVISCLIPQFVSDEQLSMILVYSIGYPVEVIMGFLFSPIINGYVRAFYRASYTESIEMKDLFYHFHRGRYGKALSLNIRLLIRMLIPIIIIIAPVILYDVYFTYTSSDFSDTVIFHDIRFLLSVLSTLCIVLYSLRYFTVLTVSTDNPEFTTKQIFAYNKQIMRHRTGNAAKLIFSFTPWLLLCLLILPMLYVIPYMSQSLCISAKWLTKAAIEETE